MFLLKFLALAALVLGSAANNGDVLVIKIGAIFFDSEMALAEAFDAAVEEVNALMPELQLEAIKHYVTIDDSIVLQDLSCDMIGNGVAAILGPSSKTTSDIVEVLCNMTGIPHLQFDWHPQQSARERLNHQLTINVAPSELIISTALSDILRSKEFDWKSFTIAYERDTLTPKQVKPPYKTQRLQLTPDGQREDFNLEVYNPIIDRVTHIWNKDFQLVDYETIRENSTQAMKQRRLENKEDFSRKPVVYTVATRVGKPYFSWRKEPEGVHFEGNERFEGYAVDLIYELARECKFDFVFEPVRDNKYGSYDAATDEWDGIIRQLIDNNAQIGICDLTITQARRTVVDFTVPFMQLGISILSYKQPPAQADIYGFLNPYGVDVWLYVMVAMLVTAMALILAGRMDPCEWEAPVVNERREQERENIWHLHNTMWLVLGSILNQGCDLLPRGLPMRLLTAFWWIFALLISQTYIASLAAFITSSKMTGNIASLHDLIDQNKVKFGTIRGGATSVYFSESNDTENRMAWNKMLSLKPDAFTKNNEEGVDRVKVSRGTYAFLMETTNLQYYVQRNCELTQIGESFGEKHYGIAVPLNAHFRSNLSVGILKLSERGVLYNLKSKWFNNNETTCESGGTVNDDGQFDMDAVGGLFVVLIVGVLISFVIGIGEFLWHVHRIAFKERIKPMVALKGELNFLLRVWLNRKPLRTYRESRDSTSTGYSSLGPLSSTASVKKKKKSKNRSE
ncbi:PREDICTED: glutamate receptor ionotropic, kainate 1 [Drosophila arizonae]|uniref:Glutamate receptor ionotropic, kainate 1 n=1 Tax=Drosophila arizonae TaxID=7263 RepID=A0ABM1NP81_DROAR|nr:PREDICTED: glutamate receptor ionotropic, kainate 1 [Drosophila arizonae]